MSIAVQERALAAWEGIRNAKERARTLAATHYADIGNPDAGLNAVCQGECVKEFCKHWRGFVESLRQEHVRCVNAVPASKLLVNLGGSVMENAGMALEHVCGMPVVPGSAVKGAARRYAVALLACAEQEAKDALLEQIVAVFGCVEQDMLPGSPGKLDGDLYTAYGPGGIPKQTVQRFHERKGLVNFLQAVPSEAPRVVKDILTPHHAKYMSQTVGGHEIPATDDEAPVPCLFPAVYSAKTLSYLFVLHAPTAPHLLDTAAEWLGKSLSLFGIGAKNAAGYGLFTVEEPGGGGGFTLGQQAAIAFIAKKREVAGLFASFAKDVEKGEEAKLRCWALLRAACLPKDDPESRQEAYVAFRHSDTNQMQRTQLRAFKKNIAAIEKLAEEYQITLPQV